ncbi:GatB/YqeY domain-containing protein [Nocardia sp. NPDC060259]|uniref:GatB/YqeY domain-containing protein n=1 Tax=Nocardia sp. NPDC060259 TaxID=3347088 RepID=UPI0036484BF2
MTPGVSDQPDSALRERLRAALKPAMRARDRSAISALRSALGAIDNAESIDAADVKAGALEDSAVGLGAAEAHRRDLTEADIADIVRREISERRDAAAEYGRLGATDRRDSLTAEADTLAALL